MRECYCEQWGLVFKTSEKHRECPFEGMKSWTLSHWLLIPPLLPSHPGCSCAGLGGLALL